MNELDRRDFEDSQAEARGKRANLIGCLVFIIGLIVAFTTWGAP